jgi:hypothetical protein
MSQQWLRIDEQKPKDAQLVFYYFGVFDKVYKGMYSSEVFNLPDEDETTITCNIDYFGGRSGFLGDDVTYWMPREDGDNYPEPPTSLQKSQCLYHPIPL